MTEDSQQKRLIVPVFKVILMGSQKVGKTTLINTYTSSLPKNKKIQFDIGLHSTKLLIENKQIKLSIWDPVGQQKYSSLTRSFYRFIDGVILLYDVTNRKSFKQIRFWMDQIWKETDPNIQLVLVGNKTDLIQKRQVTFKEGQNLAYQNNITFYQCNINNQQSIKLIFQQIAERMLKKVPQEELIKQNKTEDHTLQTSQQSIDIKNEESIFLDGLMSFMY